MASKVNEEKSLLELPGDEPGSPEAEEAGMALESRTPDLESLVVQRNEELARLNARLTELEQAIVVKDEEIAHLSQTRIEMDERLIGLSGSLDEAVTSYRDMVLQANPEIVGELITGNTVEAINESLNQARDLVSKVRQGLESELSSARIPAGAPERTAPDLSALSPREKIQYAIGRVTS